MDEKMIALLYLISLGVFFLFLVIATISVIASSIKKKKKAKKAKKQGKTENQDYDEEEYNSGYEELDREAAIKAVNSDTSDDIFAEAVMEATQIANETAAEVSAATKQPAQTTQKPVAPVQMAQPMQQPVAPVQPEVPAQQVQQPVAPVQPEIPAQQVQQPVAPVQPMQQPVTPVQPEVPTQPMQQPVAPVQPEVPVQPMQPEAMDNAQIQTAPAEDSAFVDSAFTDSAFVDSAFTDSAFADSAFSNNVDGNAFPGSAFENPTLVDPSAMAANVVTFTHGGVGQDPVGNFYWYNKEDVADRPDYKPEEMYYRYFTTANECIEDLLIEMYDCALVRTEEIRYIAYGIEPRQVAMRDVAATGNAAYNAAKKRKEPTKEDLDKIYRKWCSYVDKLFEIVEFRADNTTIGLIRDRLYEFGKSDVEVIIEGK